MQKQDLDIAAELFESASDGTEEDYWATRLSEHIDQALKKHGAHIRSSCSALEQQLEVLRARLEIHEIVADRLESRASLVDAGLADAFHKLRAENAAIIQMIFEVQTSAPDSLRAASTRKLASPRGGGDHFHGPVSPAKRGAGTSAFAAAAAARQAGAGVHPSSPSCASSTKSPSVDGSAALGGSLASPRLDGSSAAELSPRMMHNNLSPALLTSPGYKRPGALNGKNGYMQIHGGRPATVPTSRPAKELLLRQLRDIIRAVYTSKAEHDQRCRDLGEPRETMEQHLYNFLSKRYGLKSVVQEWAMAIFRSVQKYAKNEVEVVIFGKILQNGLSESFTTVEETLRTTVQQLLRQGLEQQHATRDASEIDALWRARVKHGFALTECEEVVRYMYNDRDCAVILSRLHTLAEGDLTGENDGEAEVIKYRDFVQALLRFQLELTERFLSEFVQIFRHVDTDSDGIIHGNQIGELIHLLASIPANGRSNDNGDLAEQERGAQVAMRTRRRVTFSECVDLLTGLISARWACVEEPD